MTDDDHSRTRAALHAVAELILAGPQHRASATIKLRVSPGGFRTCADPALEVVGTDLVAHGKSFPISGHTARELAVSVNVVAGAPLSVYTSGSGVDLDDQLTIDAAAAAKIASAYSRGDAALRLLAPPSNRSYGPSTSTSASASTTSTTESRPATATYPRLTPTSAWTRCPEKTRTGTRPSARHAS